MSNNATVTIPYNEYQDLLKFKEFKMKLSKVLGAGRLTKVSRPDLFTEQVNLVVNRTELESVLSDVTEKIVQIR